MLDKLGKLPLLGSLEEQQVLRALCVCEALVMILIFSHRALDLVHLLAHVEGYSLQSATLLTWVRVLTIGIICACH